MVNIKPTILTNAVILLFQPLIYRKNRMTFNIVIIFLTICYSLRQPFDIREELKHSFFMKYSATIGTRAKVTLPTGFTTIGSLTLLQSRPINGSTIRFAW